MVRKVELTGDVGYGFGGNPITVNGVSITHREPTAAVKNAVKRKLLSIVEDELEDFSGGPSFRNENGLYVRGSENDYSIAVVAKKDTLTPFKGTPSGTPMTIAIVNRISKATNTFEYELVGVESNKVRVHTVAGDFEVKVTKKKDRVM